MSEEGESSARYANRSFVSRKLKKASCAVIRAPPAHPRAIEQRVSRITGPWSFALLVVTCELYRKCVLCKGSSWDGSFAWVSLQISLRVYRLEGT